MIKNKQLGFTIVELLIVIVVIAILAAISIVVYNGTLNRARASAASSALNQAAKKIAVWQVDNPNITPTSLAIVGVTDGSDVTYQYKPGTSGIYCITATSGNVSYTISNGTQPTVGACLGHGSGGVAAITNLVTNPSFESNSNDWGENSGKASSRVSAWSQSGTTSVLMYNNTAGAVGLNYRQVAGFTVSANTTYLASAYIKDYNGASGATIRIEWRTDTLSSISTVTSASITPSTTPSRITISGTAPANATNGRIWIASPNAAPNAGLYIDSVMASESSNVYSYADGNSLGWDWINTPNNSSSTGPQL